MRGVDLLFHLQEVHVSTNDFSAGPPVRLLNEWYRWWLNSDTAPVKMPEALHIRTAMALQALGYDVTTSPDSPATDGFEEIMDVVDFENR